MKISLQGWIHRAIRHPAAQAFARGVRPLASSSLYPVLAGGLAFAGAISMTVPNVPLVCALVALDRSRWRRIAACMAIGSALAAALVAFLVEHWGRDFILEAMPRMIGSPYWSVLSRWLWDWGFAVLVVVTASPISQTPVIFAVALLGMPLMEVFAAAFFGKLTKYGTVAYLTHRTTESAAALHPVCPE